MVKLLKTLRNLIKNILLKEGRVEEAGLWYWGGNKKNSSFRVVTIFLFFELWLKIV